MRVFSRNHLLLLALTAVAIAVPALAQQPVSKYPDCPANFSAGQNDQDAARGAWLAGKAAFEEADYNKAIDYFKDAYKRDCTKQVLLKDWIARSYESKGDKAEAINALETYLARMPKADDAEQVRKHIENLKAQMTPANTGTGPASTVTGTATSTSTSTAPTATATDTAPPPSGGHSVAPWVVVGVGGAALVGGIIMLVVGSGKVSDSKSLCPNNACPATVLTTAQSENKSGYTLETVGLIVGGLGVVGVAGGLVWHFLEPTGEKKAAFAPVITPGYAGAAVSYKF